MLAFLVKLAENGYKVSITPKEGRSGCIDLIMNLKKGSDSYKFTKSVLKNDDRSLGEFLGSSLESVGIKLED